MAETYSMRFDTSLFDVVSHSYPRATRNAALQAASAHLAAAGQFEAHALSLRELADASGIPLTTLHRGTAALADRGHMKPGVHEPGSGRGRWCPGLTLAALSACGSGADRVALCAVAVTAGGRTAGLSITRMAELRGLRRQGLSESLERLTAVGLVTRSGSPKRTRWAVPAAPRADNTAAPGVPRADNTVPRADDRVPRADTLETQETETHHHAPAHARPDPSGRLDDESTNGTKPKPTPTPRQPACVTGCGRTAAPNGTGGHYPRCGPCGLAHQGRDTTGVAEPVHPARRPKHPRRRCPECHEVMTPRAAQPCGCARRMAA